MQKTREMSNSEDVSSSKDEALHGAHSIPQTLVVVGTETAVFDTDSPVRKRIKASIEAFQAVHVVVLCGGNFPTHAKMDDHIFLHPTNSRSRLMRVFDAMRIGRRLPTADVVTVQDPFETGFVGWIIAQKLGAALHVQVHTDFLSPQYAKLSLTNQVRVLIAGFVLRRAARVRVVSPRIKDSIEKRYALTVPVRVLPIFVDLQKYALAPHESNPGETTLLVVARNAPEKNISLAIESFKKVAPVHSRLLICSKSSIPQSSTDRIQYVEGDAASLYARADLVLVPSKYEGYGMVIIEALAAGVPVLSTDVGIAREAGAIVTTEEYFADALAEWFKSGPRRGELKYRPYASFEEYVRIYDEDIASCIQTQKSQ